ncbi:MAG: formamidopyrimidine-DNA glycosylase [Candidatus Methanofishera endochildressiae]|uniref:Formamidopyrimidine-DNA glycosylase n=1 Tax=Candidatus Methanofishera endochildressiae TaxID=2738884 RepID=A0A7Z0SDM3_9GAMM|nr:formamidopyrimidine-DNA glycosylase [Candidatus Methanofishera endochildressiae]
MLALCNQARAAPLRDFVSGDGKRVFKQELSAYGRAGRPCKSCQRTLIEVNRRKEARFVHPDAKPNRPSIYSSKI